jgi:hypothetical protein
MGDVTRPRPPWTLDLHPWGVAVVLAGLAATLGAAALVVGSRPFGAETQRLLGSGGEMTVGAWFNSVELVLVAGLLASVAVRTGDVWVRRGWLLLAGTFAVLSADEIVALHEVVDYRLGLELGPLRGMLVWAALAVTGLVVLAVLTLPVLRQLPVPTLAGLAVAAALYLGGALGLDYLGAEIAVALGRDSTAYRVTSAGEELLEGVGLAVLVGVLASYQRWREPAAGAGPRPHALAHAG